MSSCDIGIGFKVSMDHIEEQRNELEALSEIYYNEIEGKIVSSDTNSVTLFKTFSLP